MKFFRDLTPEEEVEFRQWARDNWKVGDEISPCWHPVVKDECSVMTTESLEGFVEGIKNLAVS